MHAHADLYKFQRFQPFQNPSEIVNSMKDMKTWQWFSILNEKSSVFIIDKSNFGKSEVNIHTALFKIDDLPPKVDIRICDVVEVFIDQCQPVYVRIDKQIIREDLVRWMWKIYTFDDDERNILAALQKPGLDLYDNGQYDQIT